MTQTVAPSPTATANPTATTAAPPVVPPVDESDARIAYVTGYVPQSDLFVMRPDGTSVTNLTNSPIRERGGSFSPDGKWILYTTDGNQLWLRQSNGSETRRLADDVCGVTWSPDSLRFAYIACPRVGAGDWKPTMQIVGIDGSNSVDLGVGGWDIAWSPDGDQIAYTVYDDDGLTTQIHVVGVDGTGAKRLTDRGGRIPVWSPDGTRIAYNGGSGDYRPDDRVHVMNADGSGTIKLPSGSGWSRDPSWSPDGQYLVYTSASLTYPGAIVVAPVTGGRMLTIGRGIDPSWSPVDDRIIYRAEAESGWQVTIVNADGSREQVIGSNILPTWSPDGHLLLYAGDSGFDPAHIDALWIDRQELFVVQADGAEPVQLTHLDLPSDSDWTDWSNPEWAPDGVRLAVGGKVGVGSFVYSLFLVNADGSAVTVLDMAGADPRWSPDGTALLYVEPPPHQGGFPPSHLMSIMNVQSRAVTEHGHGFDPVWSPDGSRIAFVGPGPEERTTLFIMNRDGSGRVELASDGAGLPAWSPDGTKIAFVSYRDGNPEIYVINVDGTGLVNLTGARGIDDYPVWSPDGSLIAFLSDRGGAHEIWVMRADGTSTFRVTSGTGGAPVWSPGGTMLAYASYHDGELWVVRIDGNGLRKLTTGGGRDPVWEPAIR